jgi:hypothetical protein
MDNSYSMEGHNMMTNSFYDIKDRKLEEKQQICPITCKHFYRFYRYRSIFCRHLSLIWNYLQFGYAIVQEVRCWFLTAQALVQSLHSPGKIFGGQSDTRVGFSQSVLVFDCHSPLQQCSIWNPLVATYQQTVCHPIPIIIIITISSFIMIQ